MSRQTARLVTALARGAEKAAALARASRARCEAQGWVQEKLGEDVNPRYSELARDYKTLTDVLVQEMLRRDLSIEFPNLVDRIQGEEDSTFVDADGKTVRIVIHNTEDATANLLSTLVEEETAKKLAQIMHAESPLIELPKLPDNLPVLDMENLGVWIDPIDCTAEFINGALGDERRGWQGVGLPCVTVLIGVFLRSTGEPIIGVVNQPFYYQDHGRYIWGFCHGGVRCNNVEDQKEPTRLVMLSGVEKSVVPYRLLSDKWKTAHPPGAGYKLLQVCTGSADAYVLSCDTTYRWDTCAPHAILRSIGGDILCFSPPHHPLHYMVDQSDEMQQGIIKYCNRGGIIAFRNLDTLERLVKTLMQ